MSQMLQLSPRTIAGIANFAVQYNYSTISFAMLLLAREFKGTPIWASSALASSVFVGSMLGMLSLGFIGDLIGRQLALALTLSIATVSAVLSALASFGGENEVYLWIAMWRFILGIGIGGIYPLSSAVAYESTADTSGDTEDSQGTIHAATALFWQVPGHVMVYVVALILLQFNLSFGFQWRALLLSGAVPLVCIVPACMARYYDQRDVQHAAVAESYGKVVIGERTSGLTSEHTSIATTSAAGNAGTNHTAATTEGFSIRIALGDLSKVVQDPRARLHLLGVSLCWFLLDVYIYGVSIFSPKILFYIFRDSNSLTDNCWQNIASQAVTLPVAGFSVLALTCGDPRDLQIIGFLFVVAALLVFAATWERLRDHPWELFGLFCYLKGSMVLFVPATTFTLPNSLFRKEIRTSCNGIAASAGKLGAFAGSFLFPLVYELFGMVVLMLSCAFVALIGACVTFLTLPRRDPLGPSHNTGSREEKQPLFPKDSKDDVVI